MICNLNQRTVSIAICKFEFLYSTKKKGGNNVNSRYVMQLYRVPIVKWPAMNRDQSCSFFSRLHNNS